MGVFGAGFGEAQGSKTGDEGGETALCATVRKAAGGRVIQRMVPDRATGP